MEDPLSGEHWLPLDIDVMLENKEKERAAIRTLEIASDNPRLLR